MYSSNTAQIVPPLPGETTEALPLWLDPILKCPQCGRLHLDRQQHALVCSGCGASYPVYNGVPMMLRPNTMTDVAAVLGHHLGGVDPEAIQLAFGTALRFRLNDRTLRDEFTQIVDRYAKIFEPDTAGEAAVADPKPLLSGKAVLKAEYYNPLFEAGETSFRSFRVLNTGTGTLGTVGGQPFHLSYWLEDANGVKIEGVRSRFPIPLLPGHELTVPLRIVAPPAEGTYRITVMVVQEYVGWHLSDPVYVGEMIVSPPGHTPGHPPGHPPGYPPGHSPASREPQLVIAPHAGFFDFEQDLARCGDMLAQAIGMVRAETGKADLTILEVACGNDPQALRHFQPGTNVVACDLAFPQIQLGALAFRRLAKVPPERYAFMAADVFNMPFEPASFDLVVVCAALHHFVDIIQALNHLKAMLSPCGKLVLMREPGKVVPEDATYISELANGFNEQQFVLAEYQTMFERTGLSVRHHRMDFECSYKVILETAPPAPAPNLVAAPAPVRADS